ncbi:MAG TPA: LuxR C-terminal-related transcriptional regulator [Streptosporangiaceae bacterium]|jgi:DNA-binding CsgD family transcriptional regulator
MADLTRQRSAPADRGALTRTARELVLGLAQRRTPPGISIVIEGPPGIGKTFLAQDILTGLEPGAPKVLRVAGERGLRSDPFTAARQLLGGQLPGGDPADAAFDHVDELCADGPVVLCADDAHHLDGASLTLLRRLMWASRNLPLAVLVTTRPDPSRATLSMLVQQAQVRLQLPPMGRMLVERLVFDRTGRWPGPRLGQALGLAAGNPLFVVELLRAYQDAGALARTGPDSIEATLGVDLPVGLDEVIRAHLRELDEPTRDVLAAIAVWGTDIGADDLAGLLPGLGTEPGQLIEQALASGLVRLDPAGTAGFTHDLFREVAYGELPDARRRALHTRAAQLLEATGYRPAVVADHLLRAGGARTDPALVTALRDAVAATRGYAPEVTADLLDDVALSGADLPEALLPDHAQALFLRGRGEAAEALVRARVATVTDPAVATRLQIIMIRSLTNRGAVAVGQEVLERTMAVPGLPAATHRELEAQRAWLLFMAGRPLPAIELDALLARFTAAGDSDAQATVLTACSGSAFLAGQLEAAHDFLITRDKLLPRVDAFRSRSSAIVLTAMVELARSGPPAAMVALQRARALSAERQAPWLGPFLGFIAGGIACSAGDWDDAEAELQAALEQAAEAGAGWISIPVGVLSYIDAHRGNLAQARTRLDSFRHRGLPLQFGHDRPGLAELAVLEAEGALREAGRQARTLWSAARGVPGRWATELAPDVMRIAITGMDRRLADQVAEDAPALCQPHVAGLVRGMLAADPDAIGAAAAELQATGRHMAEAFAREELACAAATAGDREGAGSALEAALAGYRRMGAQPDRDRALGRLRALGVRRGPREAHRDASFGWDSLTVSEVKIAALVRDGLTNREIGTRLYVSPRTVQTHVSHILQKTGLRSRVEIARAAGPDIRRLADV